MGPLLVISPLPTSWLGLGGDGYFGYLPLAGVPGPFLRGWLPFPSFYCLDIPLLTTLGVDVEAPFFSFYLHAAADALTKALYLPASISAKDKR